MGLCFSSAARNEVPRSCLINTRHRNLSVSKLFNLRIITTVGSPKAPEEKESGKEQEEEWGGVGDREKKMKDGEKQNSAYGSDSSCNPS